MSLLLLAGMLGTFLVFPAAILPKNTAEIDKTVLTHEGVLPVSLATAWNSFATGQGQEAWNVAHAAIDLKVGGLMQTNYRKEGRLGEEGTIENTILSYDPNRMISFQVTRFPKGFPFPNAIKTVWHVLYFESVDATHTKVILRGLGYTSDKESQQMRDFFQAGNAETLNKWKAHFAKAEKP